MDNNYRDQLLEKINEIKHEIEFRQNRLEYNICAGVCHKSIKAQRKTIFLLDLQLQHLEYKYQHDKYRTSRKPNYKRTSKRT